MPRYIEQLTENITPASGDWLWIVDVSAEATDQDRKLSVGKLALLATTTGQQLTVLAASASTVGLVVDTAASPTANIQSWRVNGGEVANISNAGNANVVALKTLPTAEAGKKNFSLQAAGSASTVDLVTAVVTAGSSAFVAHVRMVLARYDNNGMAVYDGYAYAYNSGSTFTIVGVDVTKAVLSTPAAPTLAWSGSGSSRILQVTNNATFSEMYIEISCSVRYGSFTFA